MTCSISECPDAIGWSQRGSVLIECKASRDDFKADSKKYFRKNGEYGVGEYRYYMAPDGLINVDELPDMWGLIEIDRSGQSRVLRKSEAFRYDARNEHRILLSLLCRVDMSSDKHVKIKSYNPNRVENTARATFTLAESDRGLKGLDGYLEKLQGGV